MSFQDIQFETGKATLLPSSYAALDIVGQVLTQQPDLKVEVRGHTDSQGSDAANKALSQARADSVLSYLKQKYPNLKPEQYTAKGMGETAPLVPNTTEANRAKNRRVEFVVMNKDVLRKEYERRRQLEQPQAPPNVTKPAVPDSIRQSAPPDTTRR
jgi:outer membrane protein OmpA-like peptidoglycan-associated protein